MPGDQNTTMGEEFTHVVGTTNSFNPEAPTVQEIIDNILRRFNTSIGLMTEATEGLGAALSQTTNASDGNENEGGTDMPEQRETTTIRVPVSAAGRAEVFDILRMRSGMMSQLDEATWIEALRKLTQYCNDVNWSVRRGEFLFSRYPHTEVEGQVVRIDEVPPEVAREYVEVASNGKLTFEELTHEVPPENPPGPYYGIVSKSPIDNRAWRNYAGLITIPATQDDGNGNHLISLRFLGEHMRAYVGYLGVRREYIRLALKQQAQESVNVRRKGGGASLSNAAETLKFEEFLSKLKRSLKPEANPFTKLPMLPHKTLSSRTWGIEIEAVHIDGVLTPKHWQLKGDGSLRSLHQESMPSRSIDPDYTSPPLIAEQPAPQLDPNDPEPEQMFDHEEGCQIWEDEWDSECDCEYYMVSDAYEAWLERNESRLDRRHTEVGEWNSPVLRSFHSRGLKYLTGELEPRRTNNSAGIHVHVNAADLTPAQATKLSVLYTALEPLFQSEYKRGQTRRYCEPVSTSELVNRFNQMKSAKQSGLGIRNMSFTSRYWSVNLASLQTHGTIEFRAMGPIYNYEHLVKWAYFVREMVNIAKADVPQSAWARVRTMEDLVVLFAKYGKETPTPAWAGPEETDDVVAKIVEGLGTENRRAPHAVPLLPGRSQLVVVNDDYSLSETALDSGPRYS